MPAKVHVDTLKKSVSGVEEGTTSAGHDEFGKIFVVDAVRSIPITIAKVRPRFLLAAHLLSNLLRGRSKAAAVLTRCIRFCPRSASRRLSLPPGPTAAPQPRGAGGSSVESVAACGVLLPAESRSKVYERQQEQAIARSKRN